MLLSLLALPLIGLILIYNPSYLSNNFIEDKYNDYPYSRVNYSGRNKNLTLIIMSLNLLLSLVIFGLFNFSAMEFQFVQEHYNISNFDIYLGIDGISIYFIVRPVEFSRNITQKRGKLSNSGNSLKLLVPNNNRKIIGG